MTSPVGPQVLLQAKEGPVGELQHRDGEAPRRWAASRVDVRAGPEERRHVRRIRMRIDCMLTPRDNLVRTAPARLSLRRCAASCRYYVCQATGQSTWTQPTVNYA